MKPKTNRAGDTSQNGAAGYDCCQTPMYAVEPLLQYLPSGARIWEPAAGDGSLTIVLRFCDFDVEATDVQRGVDFFTAERDCDVIVTNPPYSIKFDWIRRCYALGRPWALLVPLETIGAGSELHPLFVEHGVEVMLLDKRVDFKMPGAGWAGGGAQFPVIWLSWKLTGQSLSYGKLTQKPSKRRRKIVDLSQSRRRVSTQSQQLQLELAA